MKKTTLLLASCISIAFIMSCQQSSPDEQTTTNADTTSSDQTSNADNEIENAKQWLIENIEEFFAEYIQRKGDFSSICTPTYTEFKMEATNIGLDGGLTEEEFKTKWGRRYNEKAGLGTGFLISAQDFDEIKVTSCEFKNETEMGDFLFELVLEDVAYQSKFFREVVVQKKDSSFLIDNVYEIRDEIPSN